MDSSDVRVLGGLMLVDERNRIVDGRDYELSPSEVIGLCEKEG